MTAKPTMGLWTSKWTRQIWWPSCDSKFLATFLAVTILSNAAVSSALDPIGSGSGIHRRTRQADGGEPEATAEPEGETESEPEPTKSPIGLSEILVRKSPLVTAKCNDSKVSFFNLSAPLSIDRGHHRFFVANFQPVLSMFAHYSKILILVCII